MQNTTQTIAEKITAAKAHAVESHRAYPQYVGHWDGAEWRPVRVKQAIRTKMGVAFEAGDVTLAKRVPSFGVSMYVTAYSFRNGIDTQIGSWEVEWLPEDAA